MVARKPNTAKVETSYRFCREAKREAFLVQSADEDDEVRAERENDVALKNKNNRSRRRRRVPTLARSLALFFTLASCSPSPLSSPFAIADSNSCVGLRTNKPLHSPPSFALLPSSIQLVMLLLGRHGCRREGERLGAVKAEGARPELNLCLDMSAGSALDYQRNDRGDGA